MVSLYGEKHGHQHDRPIAAARGLNLVAYFAHPSEIVPSAHAAALEVVELLALEGVISAIENVAVNQLTGPAWDWWLDANWRAARDSTMLGASEHILAVTRKPGESEGR